MDRLALSVVLCTCNGAAFLQAQLDSLLAQTRLPREIVVGDDASSDDTRDLLEAFCRDASKLEVRVRLFFRELNVGFVQNFSETLAQASGDILFLCDQDDVWHPDKLAVMAERFEQDPSLLLLCSDARLIDARGAALGTTAFEALELTSSELRRVHCGDALDVLLRRSMVTGATAGLRRQLLDRALPVGSGWIHDEWLAVVAAATGRIDAIERPLIDYRQHGGNQVGLRRRDWADRWRDLIMPRREQFVREVERMQSLRSQLAHIPQAALAEPLQRVAHRQEHFSRRVELGAQPRWARLPAVLLQVSAGNYRRYGTGWRSLVRDLLRHD